MKKHHLKPLLIFIPILAILLGSCAPTTSLTTYTPTQAPFIPTHGIPGQPC